MFMYNIVTFTVLCSQLLSHLLEPNCFLSFFSLHYAAWGVLHLLLYTQGEGGCCLWSWCSRKRWNWGFLVWNLWTCLPQSTWNRKMRRYYCKVNYCTIFIIMCVCVLPESTGVPIFRRNIQQVQDAFCAVFCCGKMQENLLKFKQSPVIVLPAHQVRWMKLFLMVFQGLNTWDALVQDLLYLTQGICKSDS